MLIRNQLLLVRLQVHGARDQCGWSRTYHSKPFRYKWSRHDYKQYGFRV